MITALAPENHTLQASIEHIGATRDFYLKMLSMNGPRAPRWTVYSVSRILSLAAACYVSFFSFEALSEDIAVSIKEASASDLGVTETDSKDVKIYHFSKTIKNVITREAGGFYTINTGSWDKKGTASEEIDIEIEGNIRGLRVNRSIKLFQSNNPFANINSCKNRTFHLINSINGGKRADITESTMKKALRELDKIHNCSTQDLVISFFKEAMESVDSSSFWSQKKCSDLSLQYNYARALYQGCLVLSYKDDCDLASSEFERIKNDLRQDQELTNCLKISTSSAENAIADIQSREKQLMYANVPYAFKNGDFDVAAKAAEELLKDYESNQHNYNRVNIYKNRLLIDAGVSYLMLGEIYSKTVDKPFERNSVPCNYYKQSLSYLARVTTPDQQTTSNILKLKDISNKCNL